MDESTASVQQHLILKQIISFEIPSVKIVFAAEKSELDPEKGVFDP